MMPQGGCVKVWIADYSINRRFFEVFKNGIAGINLRNIIKDSKYLIKKIFTKIITISVYK